MATEDATVKVEGESAAVKVEAEAATVKVEGEAAAVKVEAVEGFTPIADVKPDSIASVLAVVVADPFQVRRNLWKTHLADPSGRISLMMRTDFKLKVSDVVAAHSLKVKSYRGINQLATGPNSTVVVNPDSPDTVEQAAKLREWHQQQIAQEIEQRAKEGFTPLGNLTARTNPHVLAVCARQPWRVGSMIWKTLLKDESGQVVALKRSPKIEFKTNDVVACYSCWVSEFKGSMELEVRNRKTSEIVVNPDLPEASRLKEWYQNQVLQEQNQTITPIADLKKYTTANILAVCTSDPMSRTTFHRRRISQVTLRDASGCMNALRDNDKFNFALNDVIEARGVFIRDFQQGMEIVVDDATVVIVNPATEEAAKLREWYQSQGNQETVDTAATAEETSQKLAMVAKDLLSSSNLQMQCVLCNVWCTGDASYKNHLKGKVHQNNLRKRNHEVGAGDGPLPKKPRGSGEPVNEIRCDVCDTTMVGQITYDTHIKGAKHMKKVHEKEAESFVSTIPHIEVGPCGLGYRCTLCQVTMSSKVVILNHIKGAKHTKKARTAPVAAAPVATTPVATATIPQPLAAAGQV